MGAISNSPKYQKKSCLEGLLLLNSIALLPGLSTQLFKRQILKEA
jgi:hypothetical protein